MHDLDVHDLIDRHATIWNRAWIILTGLWMVGAAAHLPSIAGTVLAIVAWSLLAAAVGLVELAMAIWYRVLRDPARDRWSAIVDRERVSH